MGTILYNIFIMPIELFIEIVFNVMNLALRSPGFSIIFVSIAVQLLCFPLYKRADAIQEQDRQKQKEMKPWLDHIKKTFKGDERFMMQQTYYRIEDYKPIYAVKGSISLLLQIPFFIAAYNFLSNLDALKHTSFLGIADLSQPDQLIHIGTLSLNLLPILMTLFNIISGIIYTKGFPLKDKIQTYGLACIFLVILYKSPSGLVFYWTLNNLFSLLKNVFMKLIKNPKKVLRTIFAILGIVLIIVLLIFRNRISTFKALGIFALAFIFIIPIFIHIILKKIPNRNSKISENIKKIKAERTIFYLGSFCLTVLLGVLIPTFVVSSSPAEFGAANYGPIGLILQIAYIFIGFILVWINIFYIFLGDKSKKIMMYTVSILSLSGILTYFCFGKKQGVMSALFYFESYPTFSVKTIIINLILVILLSLVTVLLLNKKQIIVKRIFQVLLITLSLSAVANFISIEKNLIEVNYKQNNEMVDEYEKIIPLSKNGKNVIVLMLDRAISGYVPYFIEERPDLIDKFDGFTFYPNTMSFGYSTNYGTPALFGGYEYTPAEINKRNNESLESKQNEALSVMPVLFSENGYTVTVMDPPYAGYKVPSDLSIYDGYDNINSYLTEQRYLRKSNPKLISLVESKQKHNFVYYSLMKILPVGVQNFVYDGGNYFSSVPNINYGTTFLGEYAVLSGLKDLTIIRNDTQNTFLMMQNSTTHEPSLLQSPDYTPELKVSVTENEIKKDNDGNSIILSSQKQINHYCTNMAAMLRVGEWLDYLKEQGVYDNTRIIIVSDHGFNLDQFEDRNLNNGVNLERCSAFLMVKDFNAKGFRISDEFMTNADTAICATADIIEDAANPFTGKLLDNSQKTSQPQIITTSRNLYISQNNGNTFDTSDGEWWSVEKNIFDEKNWKKVEVE